VDRARREKGNSVKSLQTWLFGGVCLFLVGVVFVYQSLTPSDGARIDKRPDAWQKHGIYLHPYSENSGLQENDLLVAINGESLESLIERLFAREMVSQGWKVGQHVEYQVIRDGKELTISVQLSAQPFGAILAAHWGVLLYAAITQLLVVFVYLHRPKDPAAVSAFIFGMTSSHFYVWTLFRQVPDLLNGYGFWLYTVVASFLWVSNWAAGLQLVLTFPRPLPSVSKQPERLCLPYLAVYSFYLVFVLISSAYTDNKLEWINTWGQGESLVAILMFLPTLLILLRRYRLERDEASRIKIRLVVFSGLAVGSLTILSYLLPPFWGLPSLDANFIGVILLLFPASIAIAILRYQLFDIDLIIRRTLIYSSLTFSLVATYFASVIAFQQVFRSLSGGAANSQVAIVLSTLMMAALFNPLRKRIQGFIDKRFYRRRYDAAQTLETFAALLRDEVDMEELSRHLLSVVDETIQPQTASLWFSEIGPKSRDQGLENP
jgi:hypothetical protein